MQFHEITREHKNRTKRQIGRGGTRGKTSGRGHKGQKARAGHKIRPNIRDDMKRQPKLRGRGSNRFLPKTKKPVVVNVALLNDVFENGEEVTPQTLKEKNVITFYALKTPRVKILGNGDLSKKVIITGCDVSAAAREKIEKSGGSIA